MGKLAWIKVIAQNWGTISKLVGEAFRARRKGQELPERTRQAADPQVTA
jgi:hypothetical protein